MPHKPQLPEATAKLADELIAALSTKYASPESVAKKLGRPCAVGVHLRRLAQFGKIAEKEGKYAKLPEKNGKSDKTHAKTVAKVIKITEASVKAELDNAIQGGDVQLIGQLLVQVFDGFLHDKCAEFFQLRYMANWCRTKQLSGAYISKAYTLLVGHYLSHVVKLRNGEVEMDVERGFTVYFTDDAGTNHVTKVQAISPSRAIVDVRKSQRNGFHLERVTEA